MTVRLSKIWIWSFSLRSTAILGQQIYSLKNSAQKRHTEYLNHHHQQASRLKWLKWLLGVPNPPTKAKKKSKAKAVAASRKKKSPSAKQTKSQPLPPPDSSHQPQHDPQHQPQHKLQQRQQQALTQQLRNNRQQAQIRQLVKQHPELTIQLLLRWLKQPD